PAPCPHARRPSGVCRGQCLVASPTPRGLRLGLPRLPREGAGDRPWDAASRSGLAIVCIALALGLGAAYPGFLSVGNFFVTLLSVTSIGIAGLGATMLLVSGNVDLSIGGQYAFIGILTGLTARDP